MRGKRRTGVEEVTWAFGQKQQACIKLREFKNLEFRRKKKIFEDLTLLVVPKGKKQLLQHNLTLFIPRIYRFIALRGRKSVIL